jgi:hypothetical protein
MLAAPFSSTTRLRRWLTAGLTIGIGAVVPVVQADPAAAVPNPAGFVNTLIGTSNSGETCQRLQRRQWPVGGDIAQSLLNQANQNNGVWDRWTHNQGGTHVMTGDPAHAALPSIHAFGGRNFDAAGALASMVRSATTVTAADLSRDGWNVMVIGERPSLDKWLSLHYIPTNGNAWGGAGETLEVAPA